MTAAAPAERSAYRFKGTAKTAHTELLNRIAEVRGVPCQSEPEKWFSDDPEHQEQARLQCRTCPVIVACRQYAKAARVSAGTWGGATRANSPNQ